MKRVITTALGLLPVSHQRESRQRIERLDEDGVAGGELGQQLVEVEVEMETLDAAAVMAAAVEDS